MLIGLTGKAGSGKSFAAQRLVDHHGFRRVKFADPLKNMLRAIGLKDIHLEGELKEVPSRILCGKSPRQTMQTLGTEWGRDIMGEDFWLNLFFIAVTSSDRGLAPIVCDDVRFPNEAGLIRSIGGHVVQITAPIVAGTAHTHISEQYDLTSETELHIENDFGEGFVRAIDNIRETLLSSY